jgi:hypothetical protein
VVEAIRNQSESVSSLKKQVDDLSGPIASLQSAVDKVQADLKGVPDSMGKILKEVSAAQSSRDADGGDVSMGERLDLLFESIESVQESLESLLLRVVELKIQATPPPFPSETEEKVEEEPEVSEEPEEDAGPDTDTDPGLEGEEKPEPEPEKESEEELEEEPEEKPEPEPEPEIEPDEVEEEPRQPSLFNDGKTRLIVHAMIGMHNKLFVRGDEPWLSWEDGQSMDLIGIGEFSWAIDDLKDPIEVNVLLNDEFVAEGGSVVLEPGKTKRVHLDFPHA